MERLQAILARYGVPAHMITLEILEGLAMENREELNEKIDRLHAVGFSVSMDDFGSGYSSLNTLAALHIDELKLDRVFLLQQSGTGEERGRQKVILKRNLAHGAGAFHLYRGRGGGNRRRRSAVKGTGLRPGAGVLLFPAHSGRRVYRKIPAGLSL